MNVPAPQKRITDAITEYQAKCGAAEAEVAAFKEHIDHIATVSTVGGAYVGSVMRDPNLTAREVRDNLKRSAWRHIYDGLNIKTVAPAKDRERLTRLIDAPPELTLDAIREHFGDFLLDPRYHVLRGLAEAFADLDPAYRSHDKVKVGVKGLPKRVIINGVTDEHGFSGRYGEQKLRDLINALRVYRGQPHIEHQAFADMLSLAKCRRDGDPQDYDPATRYRNGTTVSYQGCIFKMMRPDQARGGDVPAIPDPSRGWREIIDPMPDLDLRIFKNGNAHLFFGPQALLDVNRALAEFYGEVLADSPEADAERPKPRASTAVSKDLQYYPTPKDAVEAMIAAAPPKGGWRILEPSCGCGRILTGLRDYARGQRISLSLLGVEVDPGRARLAREAGFPVQIGNFLGLSGTGEFDAIYMNPPFAGRHYLKHILKAIEMLKPGGLLAAILPATAWYDHKALPGPKCGERRWLNDIWTDLPVGAFRTSGTNVCTGIWTYLKPRGDHQ